MSAIEEEKVEEEQKYQLPKDDEISLMNENFEIEGLDDGVEMLFPGLLDDKVPYDEIPIKAAVSIKNLPVAKII